MSYRKLHKQLQARFVWGTGQINLCTLAIFTCRVVEHRFVLLSVWTQQQVGKFLGLHPFFASKNGWNIKQKSLFLFFSLCSFLFFVLCGQKKRNEPYPEGHPDSYGSYLAYDSSEKGKPVLSVLRPSSLLKEQCVLTYHSEVVKPFCTFRHSSTAKEGNP